MYKSSKVSRIVFFGCSELSDTHSCTILLIRANPYNRSHLDIDYGCNSKPLAFDLNSQDHANEPKKLDK